MTNRICFLLGAGISIPAHLPSTDKITKRVLSGDNIRRYSDENYYLSESVISHVAPSDVDITLIIALLEKLKCYNDLFYTNQHKRFTSYEDIYYLAIQIHDNIFGEYDNPAIKPFSDKIHSELLSLFGNQKPLNFSDLCTETINYIYCVTWQLLRQKPSQLDHLLFLRDAIHDKNLDEINISTLNHDVVLDNFLCDYHENTNDGFGEPHNNGIRYWNSELLYSCSSKVKLLKLHGSVDWFRLRPDNGDCTNETIAKIPLDVNIYHTRNLEGNLQFPPSGRPEFLIGRFNKIYSYSNWIYSELHTAFMKSLRQSGILVISGYSFSDKGINAQITSWNSCNDNHRIILIDPNPDTVNSVARGAISNKWDDWIIQDKLKIIPKGIQDVTWKVICSYFE